MVEKLAKRGFQIDMKELFEPLTETIKNISQGITKSVTETSIQTNKVLEIVSEKVLELMNDKGMIAPYLALSLVNLLKP